jgi:hypothetical protein
MSQRAIQLEYKHIKIKTLNGYLEVSELVSDAVKVPIHVRVRLDSGSKEPNSSVCGEPRAGARPSPAGLARAFGGARLAIGSYVCGWSRASLAYPHAQTV